MYISGGENVYPAEVEAVLLQHPAVGEAAVIGVPHAKWGEVGEAHVVLHDGCVCSGEQLLAFAGERLARYKLPQHIVFSQQGLPRTPTGKIRKNLLRG
jgi:fatty-acyl-CoA synthase